MKAIKFHERLKAIGHHACEDFKKPIGKGNFIRCPATPVHTCQFIFHKPITATIIKLQPRFDRKEQRRLDNSNNIYKRLMNEQGEYIESLIKQREKIQQKQSGGMIESDPYKREPRFI